MCECVGVDCGRDGAACLGFTREAVKREPISMLSALVIAEGERMAESAAGRTHQASPVPPPYDRPPTPKYASARATMCVLADVAAERRKQDAKWGPVEDNAFLVSHPMQVLTEEVGEVATAQMHESREHLIMELIQVAAVAVAWIELLQADA